MSGAAGGPSEPDQSTIDAYILQELLSDSRAGASLSSAVAAGEDLLAGVHVVQEVLMEEAEASEAAAFSKAVTPTLHEMVILNHRWPVAAFSKPCGCAASCLVRLALDQPEVLDAQRDHLERAKEQSKASQRPVDGGVTASSSVWKAAMGVDAESAGLSELLELAAGEVAAAPVVPSLDEARQQVYSTLHYHHGLCSCASRRVAGVATDFVSRPRKRKGAGRRFDDRAAARSVRPEILEALAVECSCCQGNCMALLSFESGELLRLEMATAAKRGDRVQVQPAAR